MESIGPIAAAMYFIGSGSSSGPLFVLRSPILWGIAGVGVGIYFFFRGFPHLRRKRLIQNTPTSTIRGAALGAVEVSGTVVGPYTLISPLSESDCLYYHAVARSRGEEEKDVAEEVLYAPFFLDDGTGRLMVDPRGAEMELRPSVDEEYSPSTGDTLTRRFLVRRGLSSTAPAKLQEYCIRPGDHLFVLATLRENPGGESATDGLAGDAVQGQQGLLSAAAADLQRRTAIESMLPPGSLVPPRPKTPPVETDAFDLNPPVVLMKSASGEPFFISWRSQRDVVQELALRSALYIWGGPVLALAGLWLLLTQLFGR